jgi:hypothetical protein
MIPRELQELPRWVCHKSKVPMDAKTGKAASSTDPSTWASFEEAEAGVEKWGCDGIGFVLTEPYIGIDLDHSIKNGELNDLGRTVVEKVGSYSEVSPSGTGIHIIAKGVLPFGALKTGTKNKEGKIVGDWVEVYQKERYFTMTGRQVPGTVPVIREADVSFLYPEDRKTADGTRPKAAPIAERLASVSEGNRNMTFLSLAGSLHAKKFDVVTVYELLKPRAEQEKFPLDELWAVCNKYAPKDQPSEDDDSFDSFMSDIRKVEWLCEPIIAKAGIGFVSGIPGVAKSWAAFDLAIECARGGAWLGRYPVAQSRVFVIEQERDKSEIQRRMSAMLRAKGLTPKDLEGRLVLKCGTTFRLDHQQSFEGLRNKLAKFQPDLIVWDSFATAHSSDEMSKADMQFVMEQTKALRKEFGCAVLFVDHEGKGAFGSMKEKEDPNYGYLVGSIGKPAAAETVLTVRREDAMSSWVYHTKSTMGPTVPPFLMRVRDAKPDKSEVVVEVC